MTFLIITEDPSAGAGLAERIKAQSPDSFCFSVAPSAVEEALNAVRVDCAVCPPELTDLISPCQPPRLTVWPPEMGAEDMAEALLAHRA